MLPTKEASIRSGDGLSRPYFDIGHHTSSRDKPLTEVQYGTALDLDHLLELERIGAKESMCKTTAVALPIVPPLTVKDTSLFPSEAVSTYIAWVSPWIELGSPNPVVSSVSRQVLNLEVAYANFCGVRSIVIPGPRAYGPSTTGWIDLVQYARALREALAIGNRMNMIVSMPMTLDYDNPNAGYELLSAAAGVKTYTVTDDSTDSFSSWDAWHTLRSLCGYNARLSIALVIPSTSPDRELIDRWFAEPLYFLVLDAEIFRPNQAGCPTLTEQHQQMIYRFMRLKNTPWLLLRNIEVDVELSPIGTPSASVNDSGLSSIHAGPEAEHRAMDTRLGIGRYVQYLKALEARQEPIPVLEESTLASFQDWLQSPLQPLSDNLESATYEVFEGDPIKYNQYELALYHTLVRWRRERYPTSSSSDTVVLAVAGSGRGPLVTRALKAGSEAGVPIQVWAVEKNPNAYVYLLRQNERIWGGRVNVVKTDMRAWKGPVLSNGPDGEPVYGKVDIVLSELLGSFGDNELSPECLDGIQHVLARPHGISIPKSYTAHLSPISAPRIHADLLSRTIADPDAFDTPWVVRLFAVDFVSRHVPRHPRFQRAWEFSHPIPDSTLSFIAARRSGGVVGGGGGSMAGAAGANDHNSRYCRLTFVCPHRGVIHGLAGYFETILFESAEKDEQNVELSILPNMIDQKCKDMISWFPIFFPLRKPIYFPDDTELDVSMWRQTDDTRVWYEWLVEAKVWISKTQRLKIASSELCTSRKVACRL